MKVIVGNVEHDLKVAACASVPRLGFMDNFFCAFGALSPLGIPMTKGTGAFWDQTMCRILTELSKEEAGNFAILTMDYDSVFEIDCVTRLMSAMLISGVDAIAPLQVKRDDKTLMFTPEGMAADGPREISLPAEYWEKQAQPADTAHFGLTFLRCDAIRRMPKPWFWGQPGPDGDWGDGRIDPDIAWWKKWKECGNTLAICPQVSIGHAELVITWPDQRLKTVYQYPAHYWNAGGKRPPEAWGSDDHLNRSMSKEQAS